MSSGTVRYSFSSVPVGTGLIDMPGVVDALYETGYRGVLAVESDHHKDNQDEGQKERQGQPIGEVGRVP